MFFSAKAKSTKPAEIPEMPDHYEVATLAGGCFWCTESEYQAIEGVEDVFSGYTGGDMENPTYQDVLKKDTGHVEAIQIFYDPTVINYERILEAFWLVHDPTQANGQGPDIGPQYVSRIFYHNEEQKEIAERSMANAQKQFDKPIATKILPATTFYPAEEYHQDYNEKQGVKYKSVFDLGGKSHTIRKYEKWGIR